MTREETIIRCPACKEEMSKVRLDKAGFCVDICSDGCGGIWLDNRELDKIDEEVDDIHEITELLEYSIFKEVDKSATRKCPICNLPMVKRFSSPTREVELDECYICGGKFLDNNELQIIRKEFEYRIEKVKATPEEIKKLQVILKKMMKENEKGEE